MDRLEALGATLSQITLYDIKSAYNQAKNVVLNISEMEAKVREATNEDPWGASSTLMQEIAQGTFSFQHFNEIMPCIYARFMEKEARQWRQIYKALQLLEYLIKHGSERVVDDARSHVSTIKMLRNFHYIDDKGKDEGVNVRNRSREIVELLADVEKIRSERRKAKANKHKYAGTGSDGLGMSFSSGGSRYGGFGNDSLGGGGSYGNDYGSYGAGGSGAGGSSFRDDARRGGFEEYNAGDDEISSTPATPTSRSQNSRSNSTRKAAEPTPASAPAAPVEDLLGGFDDDDAFGTANSTNINKALPAVNSITASLDDDDFSDFQAAPVQPSITGNTTGTLATPAKPNLLEMLNSTPPSSRTAVPQPGFGQVQQQPVAFNSFSMGAGGMGVGAGLHRSSQSISSPPQYMSPVQSQTLFGGGGGAPAAPFMAMGATPLSSTPAARPVGTPITMNVTGGGLGAPAKAASTGSGGAFDDLWSMSLGAGASSRPAGSTGKSIKDLEKEKAMAGLWGNQKPVGPGILGAKAPTNAFGSMGGGGALSSGGGGGDDNLLL